MDIRAAILDLARQRAPGGSFCPSEVARALSPDWRPLMPAVRAMADRMPEIRATQKGQPVDPTSAKGPIRLSLAPETQTAPCTARASGPAMH